MKISEANFDGLVGPTHHYAGLSFGNVASTRNAKLHSQPKKAALQGIAKAAKLRDLGLDQGILPPLRRPRLDTLRSLGFSGSDASVIERAAKSVPQLLSACYSASSMWVANAATFSPSCDSADGRVHLTPANLSSKFHRSLEPKQTGVNLRRIFNGPEFVHHEPVVPQFGDEGAANHIRLAGRHGEAGLEIFVFGGSILQDGNFQKPKKYPARQAVEASEAIANTHELDLEGRLFIQQNPDAIDSGVFHNDVVSVGNENVLFLHERAFFQQSFALESIRRAWRGSRDFLVVEILDSEVSLEDAISSYLFNSQLVTLPENSEGDHSMALICPEECRENPKVKAAIERVISEASNPIQEVHYFDVRESMRNGGGPACLRFRGVFTSDEKKAVHPGIWLSSEREQALITWVNRHYRDRLSFDDLRDPKLFLEVTAALDDLERVLSLPLA
ncbi:MAG: N-succinylarginine dihydrolase [Cryobacterium sp.]|nr:N-succinylarginine dihydrolase [Oligoflexia bacterium]